MWFLAGTEVDLTVDFAVGGEFVRPETARYDLRDASGNVLQSGYLPADGTTAKLRLPASLTAITGEYESRFVNVVYQLEGESYQKRIVFHLTGFLPLTGTPSDVRARLSLDVQELPDEDIDLHRAYYSLRWQNNEAFREAFTLGGERAARANEAVVLRAALDIASSIELRTRIVVRAEDSQVSRSNKIDFDRLRTDLNAQLAEALRVATGTVESTFSVFELSNPAEPFSG